MVEKYEVPVKTVTEHYDNLSNEFNRFWNYSNSFVASLTADIRHYLDLKSGDVFVDIGCGTGLYTLKLVDGVVPELKTICVDVSSRQLQNIPDKPGLVKVLSDAYDFAKAPGKFDKILLKEVMHHVKKKDELIKELCRSLNISGRVLIIISPVKVNYPLFRKALSIRNKGRSIKRLLVKAMTDEGLTVEVYRKKYQVKIEKERYFEMVRGRYMSFLSSLSDDELSLGVKEMEKVFSTLEHVVFFERYIFILGQKTPIP